MFPWFSWVFLLHRFAIVNTCANIFKAHLDPFQLNARICSLGTLSQKSFQHVGGSKLGDQRTHKILIFLCWTIITPTSPKCLFAPAMTPERLESYHKPLRRGIRHHSSGWTSGLCHWARTRRLIDRRFIFQLWPRTLTCSHPQIKKLQKLLKIKAARPATRTRIPKWSKMHQMLCFFPTLLWRSPLPPQAAQGHAATLRAILWQSPGVDNSGICLRPPKKNRNIPYSFPELLDFERKPKPCFPSTLLSWELLLIQPCQFALSHDLKSMTFEISNGCCPH